ncbi:MAG TPA: tetraacyldisaccharide 4'-kinase, partial [Gammaproteobacteria bacterium]|nr:tetraacyldisaccharide 4'-kinase [Gammaproteobacteria bacterium]
VHALAGIGNPERFFLQLRALGMEVIAHPFPDHHRFTAAELRFADALPVIMTEKDAVKCEAFADERCWYLAVEAEPDAALLDEVLRRLPRRTKSRES